MLRTTLACFGAGAGGADAVTVLPFDARARAAGRPSRAGSPATPTPCWPRSPTSPGWPTRPAAPGTSRRSPRTWPRAAWAVVPAEIERAGGLAAALALRARGRRARRHRQRARGASSPTARTPSPASASSRYMAEKPLQRKPPRRRRRPARRPAAVRRDARRSRRCATAPTRTPRATGSPPRVFLATLGPLRSHAARAGVRRQPLRGRAASRSSAARAARPEEVVAAFRASGATVACLCASDTLYAEQGAEVAARAHGGRGDLAGSGRRTRRP